MRTEEEVPSGVGEPATAQTVTSVCVKRRVREPGIGSDLRGSIPFKIASCSQHLLAQGTVAWKDTGMGPCSHQESSVRWEETHVPVALTRSRVGDVI